jgi:hypothetical protein
MQIDGIALALLDIPIENTREYNLWYDLDHMPEHLSKPDVIMGRRYVSTLSLRKSDGIVTSELTGGYPPYATIYSFGGPLDFMSQEALTGWSTMDRHLLKTGRFWRSGRPAYIGYWRLADARARPSVLVDRLAIPHLPHRGIILALGRTAPLEARDEAIRWWNDIHLVDLFAVRGVLASLQLTPAELDDQTLLLHVILCDAPPNNVMTELEVARRSYRATGRYPAFGGVYEEIAFLPYERIVPLEYDFDLSSATY